MNTIHDFLNDLSYKILAEQHKQIEEWVKHHWEHKPELIRYTFEHLTLHGKCPCGDHTIFKIKFK